MLYNMRGTIAITKITGKSVAETSAVKHKVRSKAVNEKEWVDIMIVIFHGASTI